MSTENNAGNSKPRRLFNSWRRKLGVVTLLLACAFMAGWVRSLTVCDVVVIAEGASLTKLESNIGQMHLKWGTRSFHFGQPTRWILPRWLVISPAEMWAEARLEELQLPNFKTTDTTLIRFMGFLVSTRENTWRDTTFRDYDIAIPYWSLVIPFTLPSVWLLIGKPRTGSRDGG